MDVNASLLRFWEKEFGTAIKPSKNNKGNRIYTQDNLRSLRLIHHLVKERGFTLDGAKKKLKQNPEELEQQAQLVDTLKNIRAMLIELRDAI